MKFSELNLHENLLKGIEEAEFTTLMPVQEQTFVHSLKGKDVSVQSQTGTGKTAAFLITIFQHFLAPVNDKNKKALILAPTRELAVQIETDARLLGKYVGMAIGAFYGGIGYHQQEKLLDKGVDLIVGTPGRLLDFNSKGRLDFRDLGFVVIDEADRMFDMGFYPDIRRIMRNTSDLSKRQTMLFSATLDSRTRGISSEFMDRPVKVEIEPEQITVDKITQRLYHVSQREKLNLLLGIFKKEMPANALVFTNTKDAAAQVAKHLEYNGYKCLHLSGDLPQNKRLKVIEQFKDGQLPFLVATDVAARGLHIDDLELIVNYDLPNDCENYVHRIGRTARAGKSGVAVSLACEDYVYNLEAIESYIGTKIPIVYADDFLFEESKSEGMTFEVRKKRSADGGGKRRKQTSRPKSGGSGGRGRSGGGRSRSGDSDGRSGESRGRSQDPRKKPRRDDRKGTDRKPRTEEEERQARAAAQKRKKKPAAPGTAGAASASNAQDRKKGYKGKGKGKGQGQVDSKGRKKSVSKAPGHKDSLEDRVEYYKKKYGDNFNVPSTSADPHPEKHQTPPPQPAKKSIIKRLGSMLKRKK